jgi:lipoprotein-anchoring transpeptidase ErfK/SrfK
MTRFAHGRSLSIGFHGIPLRANGTPIQTDAELGQYRSHGCVRMAQDAAKVLYGWAPIGTPVVVLA